jgi:hypothetical protein
MDTLSFFQRVLPSEGLYCIASFEGDNPAPRHGYFDSVEKLAQVAQALNDRGQNTYYAISTFTEKRRKQEFVERTKVLAIDVDCGIGKNGKAKPFADAKEGAQALVTFVKAVGQRATCLLDTDRGDCACAVEAACQCFERSMYG